MRRPPVHADPWVIAAVLLGLAGIAFTLHVASRSPDGQLPPPIRSAPR